MYKTLLKLIPVVSVAIFAGCATENAHYVDPSGSQVVTTVGQINIQDFANAAGQMCNSLIASQIDPAKLQSADPNKPPLVAISLIRNETGQQFDTDMLIEKIRTSLFQTGKLRFTSTQNLGGAQDPLAAQRAQTDAFLERGRARAADYTLAGKIIEDRTRAGNLRQASFIFQLQLSDPAGEIVWQDEKTISKQGTRPAVGF
jgi:uncharacterized protein (TIGR02722 family)